MVSLKKILSFVLLLPYINAYSTTEHFIEFDVSGDTLEYNTVVAFLYDTITENGPGAVVFNRTEKGPDSISFVRQVFGPTLTLKQASVKYSFFPYHDYVVNASCKDLDLQSIDSKGLFISMHINTSTQSIDCTTTRVKEPK
jgi:hypothetical protein